MTDGRPWATSGCLVSYLWIICTFQLQSTPKSIGIGFMMGVLLLYRTWGRRMVVFQLSGLYCKVHCFAGDRNLPPSRNGAALEAADDRCFCQLSLSLCNLVLDNLADCLSGYTRRGHFPRTDKGTTEFCLLALGAQLGGLRVGRLCDAYSKQSPFGSAAAERFQTTTMDPKSPKWYGYCRNHIGA